MMSNGTHAKKYGPLEVSSPLRNLVLERLQHLILSGALRRGDHLRETEIADQFGISRGPLREALQLLQRDGWVELRPRQGAFVRDPSMDEVNDFFHVKGLLEAEAARLAAARITESELEQLREIVAAGGAAIRAEDGLAINDESTHFHMCIALACGNSVLADVLKTLELRLRFYFALTMGVRNEQAWEEHAALIDALAARDADRAAQLMLEHSEATRLSYRSSAPLRRSS